MSAKSYTKVYFGVNILIRFHCKNRNFHISRERVFSPFRERRNRNRAMGEAENILKQTLYEMVILHLTPGRDTGGFLFYKDYSALLIKSMNSPPTPNDGGEM